MQWRVATPVIPQTVEQLSTVLLQQLGVANEKEFFQPTSPLKVQPEAVGLSKKNLELIVKRLEEAREKNEKVVIFGDYDADGVCSTATLWEGLRAFGIMAHPFIPHREKHGYGLSMRSLEAVLAEVKPDVLITVDNGVVAHTAFLELKKLGITTILTDHHQPERDPETQELNFPKADFLLHSTQLCGTTVAWFLARALNAEAAANSLDLAAIGTIGDQMPMLGIHRSFVVHGLPQIQFTKRVGLQEMLKTASLKKELIDMSAVNYAIVPRLNALGRLKHNMDALRLLCTTSTERAHALVEELQNTNTLRKELTQTMIEHAKEQAMSWENEHLIIVASTEYHEGVIGLIAGRLMEEYYKPAIAIAIGEKTAKASARSIHAVNIVDFIRQVRSDLTEVGGHHMAAGFGLLPENVELVTGKLLELARTQIEAEWLVPSLHITCQLPLDLMKQETALAIQHFAPFGQMNQEPVFAFPAAKILTVSTVGKEQQHLRMTVEFDGAAQAHVSPVVCMAWQKGSLAADLNRGQPIQLAGQLQLNEWKGRRSLQILLKDWLVS